MTGFKLLTCPYYYYYLSKLALPVSLNLNFTTAPNSLMVCLIILPPTHDNHMKNGDSYLLWTGQAALIYDSSTGTVFCKRKLSHTLLRSLSPELIILCGYSQIMIY